MPASIVFLAKSTYMHMLIPVNFFITRIVVITIAWSQAWPVHSMTVIMRVCGYFFVSVMSLVSEFNCHQWWLVVTIWLVLSNNGPYDILSSGHRKSEIILIGLCCCVVKLIWCLLWFLYTCPWHNLQLCMRSLYMSVRLCVYVHSLVMWLTLQGGDMSTFSVFHNLIVSRRR